MDAREIFLSYSRVNKKEAAHLREDLLAAGFQVWWDQDILPGHDWKFEVRNAMRHSKVVLWCYSSKAVERTTSGIYPEVLDAISIYRKYKPGEIFLIPVRFSECTIPPIEIDGTRTLDQIEYVDLFPPDMRNDGLERLTGTLEVILQRQADPNPGDRESTQDQDVNKQRPLNWIAIVGLALLISIGGVAGWKLIQGVSIAAEQPPSITAQHEDTLSTDSPTDLTKTRFTEDQSGQEKRVDVGKQRSNMEIQEPEAINESNLSGANQQAISLDDEAFVFIIVEPDRSRTSRGTFSGEAFLFVKGRKGYNVVGKYPVVYGLRGQDKQYEGDRRTPLGKYRITEKRRKPTDSVFGGWSLHINYPTTWDRNAGRIGRITIHGGPERGTLGSLRILDGSTEDARDGTENIDALAKHLRVGSPVFIAGESDPNLLSDSGQLSEQASSYWQYLINSDLETPKLLQKLKSASFN